MEGLVGVSFLVLYQAVGRCPKCEASWFQRRTVNKETLESRGLIFETPSKIRYYYQCNKCKHQWKEDKDVVDRIM
jgi:hypothetical protein